MVLWSGSPVDHGDRLFGEGEVSAVRAELDVGDGTVGPESVQDGLGNQGDEVDLTVRVHCQKQRTAGRVRTKCITSFWGLDSMSFIPQHLLRLFFSSISFKMFFGAACMAKTRKKSGATAQIGLNFSKLLELLHNYFRFFLSP